MCSNDQMIVIILGLARHMDFSGTVQVCPHSTHQLQEISQQRDASEAQRSCCTETTASKMQHTVRNYCQ